MQIIAAASPIIDAALSILADGKARTADEILAEGRKRGLFTASMTRKHVYTSLSQYIERAVGAGRKPELTEDVQHRFRINRAPDDWPDIDNTGLAPLSVAPTLSHDTNAAIVRAKHAEAGSDPTEYEAAICGLFSSMGFAATHVGGLGAPDGYADALLGPLSYRVMIECKLGSPGGIAQSDAPAEAAKYKDSYHGTYCTIVAPSFAQEVTFVSELSVHGVSAWTTDDLVRMLQSGVGAYDLRGMFATGGIVSDALGNLLWDRRHGAAKRLRVVASLVLEQAAQQQQLAERLGDSGDAPLFTIDVAMSVVDSALAQHGASNPCTREEMQAVFDWLTNPLVRLAVWTDATKTAIVRV
jgi:hypothetical protein